MSEKGPATEALDSAVEILHVSGVEGPSIYVNNYRVAGNKPWGGGSIVAKWIATPRDFLTALGLPSSDQATAPLIAENVRLREIVNRQAEDEGLWFVALTAPEAYLQQELRRLHAAIEEIASPSEQPSDAGEQPLMKLGFGAPEIKESLANLQGPCDLDEARMMTCAQAVIHVLNGGRLALLEGDSHAD